MQQWEYVLKTFETTKQTFNPVLAELGTAYLALLSLLAPTHTYSTEYYLTLYKYLLDTEPILVKI